MSCRILTPPVETAALDVHVPSKSVTLLAGLISPCERTDVDANKAVKANETIDSMVRGLRG